MDILGRITQLREERGWSINHLAKMSDLSQSTVSNLYNRSYEPTVSTIESLCGGFGISLVEFFNVDSGENAFLTDEQKQLLVEWSKLTAQKKESLLNLIKE